MPGLSNVSFQIRGLHGYGSDSKSDIVLPRSRRSRFSKHLKSGTVMYAMNNPKTIVFHSTGSPL